MSQVMEPALGESGLVLQLSKHLAQVFGVDRLIEFENSANLML